MRPSKGAHAGAPVLQIRNSKIRKKGNTLKIMIGFFSIRSTGGPACPPLVRPCKILYGGNYSHENNVCII